MGIDWFTLIAQIVNFLILVGVLKFFLYERIVKAIDEREERIKSRLGEAEQKKKEADDEAESYRIKKRELDEEREEILDEARKKAEERRKEFVSKAREEADGLERKWREQIEREKTDFLRDLQRLVGREVREATGRALEDMADANLESRMIRSFLSHLEELDEDEKERIRGTLGDSGKVTVESSFEIPDEQRSTLSDKIKDLLSNNPEFRFEVSDKPICGILLTAGGRNVSWSFEGYLSDLEETFSKAIEEEIQEGGTKEEKREREGQEGQDG